MCGAGAQAPSGPPWTSTTVAIGPSGASGGEAIHVSIGPPAPGASVQGHDRHRVAPLPGSTRSSSGPRVGGVAATASDEELHRADAVRAEPADRAGGRAAGRDGQRVGDDVAVDERLDAGGSVEPGREMERRRMGAAAAVSPSRRSGRPSARYGPPRLDTIQPVRSVSAHWPIGRSRSGAMSSRRRRTHRPARR